MEYKVRFVNYSGHYQKYRDEFLQTIDDVLSRGDLVLRRDVEEFEQKIASLVATRYAVALNSGTDALFFSLKAAGIGPGDEVITVAHTFVASVAVIVHCGSTPILVDVGEDFLMDMEKVEEAITPRTKAIMPVHLNGRVCEMDRLMSIAQNRHLFIIEDAAQALGAEFQGRKAGSFGRAAGFSLYPAKVLGTFGDGGVMTTNDERIAEKVRLLRDHGQKTKTELLGYGFNSRLDNLQAAILNVKLKYFPGWIQRRREIAGLYYTGLSGISQIQLPPRSDETHLDVYQNYVLRVERRDELFSYLKEKGVETLMKDPIALHHHSSLGLSHFSLPYTEQLAKEVISLPCYPELSNEEAEYVIQAVKSFYV